MTTTPLSCFDCAMEEQEVSQAAKDAASRLLRPLEGRLQPGQREVFERALDEGIRTAMEGMRLVEAS